MKLILIVIFASVVALAPSMAGGMPAKCNLDPNDLAVQNIYVNSWTYASIMCSSSGDCTETEWDNWYDYMFQILMSGLNCPASAT